VREKNIKYSIVIPCYNEANYISDTIKSLSDQSLKDCYEIIVVDNNCTDDTANIAIRCGVRVVEEKKRGVCWARQRGTEVAKGEIVISTDADTTFDHQWLAKIEQNFQQNSDAVAVVGVCKFKDGPIWGKIYPKLLFGPNYLVYLLTGHTCYASATNIAFKKKYWTGYDTSLNQGGDELDLLRRLRSQGRVIFDYSNPTHTSGRRLTRGFIYNLFISLLVYYFLAYYLNKLFKKEILSSAPAYRDNSNVIARFLRVLVPGTLIFMLVFIPFATPRHHLFNTIHSAGDYLTDQILRRSEL